MKDLDSRTVDERAYVEGKLAEKNYERLIKTLIKERNCAQENFRVTHKVYVAQDKLIKELKETTETFLKLPALHPPSAPSGPQTVSPFSPLAELSQPLCQYSPANTLPETPSPGTLVLYIHELLLALFHPLPLQLRGRAAQLVEELQSLYRQSGSEIVALQTRQVV
jgi:hypothetical protein